MKIVQKIVSVIRKTWVEKVVKVITVISVFLFGLILIGGQILYSNADAINGALNIQTSITVNDESADDEDTYYYKSSLPSIAAVKANARAYTEAVMAEGATLLKNDGALPLGENPKVSLFSVSSVKPFYTGFGSGRGEQESTDNVNFKTAFEAAGITVNPALYSFYENNLSTFLRKTAAETIGTYHSIGDARWDELPADSRADQEYGDAAIFVLSRSGGEAKDLAMWYGNHLAQQLGGAADDMTDGNYLTLSPREISVLKGLKSMKDAGVFKKIVVIMNSPMPVETFFMDDPEYGADALLWCGTLGETGSYAVADIIAGKVNPSGKLSDTFWKKHYLNPVNANFGMSVYDGSDDTQYTGWKTSGANNLASRENMDRDARHIVYQEGIYVGYRYTETRYEDVVTGRANAGDFNYYDAVTYPFGYGLSYTNFAFSDLSVTRTERTATEDAKYTVSVKVTNTGSVAGKEVMEVYLQKPYTSYDIENKIEKASVELVGFEKTKLLAAGESETLTTTIYEKQLASYDANEAKTYILEGGTYYFTVAGDSHEAINNILKARETDGTEYTTTAQGVTGTGDKNFVKSFDIASTDTEVYSTSTKAKENHILNESVKITNQFESTDVLYYEGATENFSYTTRNDWQGTTATNEPDFSNHEAHNVDVTVTQQMYEDRKADMTDPGGDGVEYPTYGKNNSQGSEGHLNLIDLRAYSDDDGDPTNDKWIPYNDPMWEQLLDQLTWEETVNLLCHGYHMTAAIESIAKPETYDHNGGCGFNGVYNWGSSGGYYARMHDPDGGKYMTNTVCSGIAASTYNKGLMEWYGKQWGEEGLWGGRQGLYGMGLNIHRSPYGGRTFEYYSEDPYLTGAIATQICIGMRTRGTFAIPKHCLLNDQEYYRCSACTWVNEQTIRELYLAPFQMVIEDGGADGVMTSFSLLGVKWSGSHGFINNVLHNEFGMTGYVVSDYSDDVDCNWLKGIMGGNDLPDGTHLESLFDMAKTGHGELAWAMRESVHRILYTVVHSNVMNGIGANTKVIVLTPFWVSLVEAGRSVSTALLVISLVGVGLILAADIFVFASKLISKKKEAKE